MADSAEAANPASFDGSADTGQDANFHSGSDWERYGEVLAVINHLELDPDAEFASLSGGTKRRVALARALVCSEDLILDEPTNHLDLATITWLENFLLRKARTLIFVSHDRAFSRRLATRVVEIDRGKLHSYSCGFDRYPERREERLAAEERAFALFDKNSPRKRRGYVRASRPPHAQHGPCARP